MENRIPLLFRGSGLCFVVLFALVCFYAPVALAAKNASFEDGDLFLPDGASITLEDFVKQARDADYILIGETHDAVHHHQMQAKLLESLARAGMKPGVGFEMLYVRDQHMLESFNARKTTVKDFEETANWKRSWSYPFAIYAPIFQVAEEFNLPVFGLNISKDTLDKVKADGFAATRALPEKDIPDLPKDVIWPLPEQITYLSNIRINAILPEETDAKKGDAAQKKPEQPKDDSGMGPMKQGDPKRGQLVQSLWDTTMAQSAINAHAKTGQPIVIMAGSGHVRNGHGIAHRINTLTPGKKILLVVGLPYPLGKDDRRATSADVFFASRPSILQLGAVFKAEADAIVVDEITKGARGDIAGMQVGDKVVSLEDNPLKGPGSLHSAIAIADLQDRRKGLTEKREKTLVVERAGKQVTLTLR